MRSVCAALLLIFGFNVIWAATGYVFDAKPTDGARPYYWAALTAAFGIAIALGSRRIAVWLTEGFEGGDLPSNLPDALVRLMGIYMLYYTVPSLAQWVMFLAGVDASATYAGVAPEFSTHAKWKMLLQIALVVASLFLVLAPRRVQAWLDRFDLKSGQ